MNLQNITPVVQTALCIIPPEEMWDPIQEIRKVHDKSYERWMPHINLLWPFIPYHFDKIKNLISSDPDFKKIKPFMINLNTFTNSPGSKYLTISVESILPNNDAEKDNNLRVNTKNVNASTTNNKTNTQKKKNNNKGPLENPLTNLYKVLHRLFPLCGKKQNLSKFSKSTEQDFDPHMTVGQVQQTEIKSLTEELQNNWTPIDFMVTEIYIISRKSDNEKMKIVETIKFGSD